MRTLVIVLILVGGRAIECSPSYWEERRAIILREDSDILGGRLEFENGERIVNDIVMGEKRREIKTGFREPFRFHPARNFLDVKTEIENSTLFRIIRRMPKGGVLHVHDMAMASERYIFENITYRDNLYVCEDRKSRLELRFLNKPLANCKWKLLSEMRAEEESAARIDREIRRRIRMRGNQTDGNTAWSEFSEIFEFIASFVTYRPVFEDYYYHGLQELLEDNVMYVELRSILPRLYDLNGMSYGPLEVAQIYKQCTESFVKDNPNFLGAKLIYAPAKTGEPLEFEGFVETARLLAKEIPDFFAGFDLVGQEDASRPLVYWQRYIRSIAPDINLFFHAGETNWNGLAVDENLLDAVLFGTKRIGHGYALTKHPRILEIAKKNKIAIEICPISNQVLALVRDMRNHPAASLFLEDVPVVVSNDDPGLWNSRGLSYDFYEAFLGIMSARADIRALKRLAINSITYSSLNQSQKGRALDLWRGQWRHFVDSMICEQPRLISIK